MVPLACLPFNSLQSSFGTAIPGTYLVTDNRLVAQLPFLWKNFAFIYSADVLALGAAYALKVRHLVPAATIRGCAAALASTASKLGADVLLRQSSARRVMPFLAKLRIWNSEWRTGSEMLCIAAASRCRRVAQVWLPAKEDA